MKAAIKAINEDNVDALTTAIQQIDDINAILIQSFLWRLF